jgi:ferredoxin-type protein NapH
VSWIYAHRYLLARRATVLGMFVLFWLGANAHLGVLTGNLSSSRLLRTVPLTDPYAALQILATGQPLALTALGGALIVLGFYAVVGGRAFCGWFCPVGLLADASRWLRRRLEIRGQFRVSNSIRYWIMALALPVSAVTGVAAFEWLSPIGIVHRELIYGAGPGLIATLGVLVLVDVYLVRDGWCGSLCPLGAFYSLLGRISLLRIGFSSERCDRCGDCVAICPEPHVVDFNDMAQTGFIASGDCLNCARCLEVCSRNAYHFSSRLVSGAKNDPGQ